MRKEKIQADSLLPAFKDNKILNLSEIKKYLGTESPMTILRKLKELSYLSCYSHRGKYYTLNRIARFDNKGIWVHKTVRFSQFGTLLNTVKIFIDRSEMGYSAQELEAELGVSVQECVLKLYRTNAVVREKIDCVYIYLTANAKIKKAQMLLRRRIESIPGEALTIESLAHELKAAIFLFYSLLDEKQRRLYAGLESFKLGHGGDCKIADLLGVDVHTIAKGRRELFNQDQDSSIEGIRKKGSGRKSVKKKSQKSRKKSES